MAYNKGLWISFQSAIDLNCFRFLFIYYCKLSQNAPEDFVFRPMFKKLKLTMLQLATY